MTDDLFWIFLLILEAIAFIISMNNTRRQENKMGIDFYDRMWEEEQKEKERFGQRKNEIEDELFSQRRKIEELEKENTEQKKIISDYESTIKENCDLLNKMRCCGNCANRIDGQEFKDGCKENWDCDDYSKWRFEK